MRTMIDVGRLSLALPVTLALTFTAPPAVLAGGYGDAGGVAGDGAHEALYRETRFPTAQQCRTCHPDHYREWSVSQHAYAQLSPIFNAMQATITQQTHGTNGDFCIRCHTQPGMILGEAVHMSNMDRSAIAQEGVTCIVCHRVNEEYGKVSGRLALLEGGLDQPIKGPTGNAELKRVLKASDTYKVVTDPRAKGRLVHGDVVKFFALESPGFCGSCHDVTLPNGFRLEEAFSEYKISPAAREGKTCQDCHMSFTPGTPDGYRVAPAALVGGVETRPRKRTNHMWVGPDYSVIHAGLFPHNPDAQKLATMREWTTFDDAAGWGTKDFEASVPPATVFPPRWKAAEDRIDAREILEKQKVLLAEATRQRRMLLSKGYQLGDVKFERCDHDRGLKLKVEVKNGGAGHNVPTGFTAERIVFLRVTVADAAGNVVYRSGDFDANGDLRDNHSAFVRTGELPLDKDLFSLQSKFITRNVRGGEREQVLAVNYSIDALPFIRPEASSSILVGRPGGARIQKRGIEPEGSRWAEFRVDPKVLAAVKAGEGLTAKIELVSGMVPVNLVREVQDVGFDYNMSPKLVAKNLLDGYMTLWSRDVTLAPPAGAAAAAASAGPAGGMGDAPVPPVAVAAEAR